MTALDPPADLVNPHLPAELQDLPTAAITDAELERLDLPDAPRTLGGVIRRFYCFTSPRVLTVAVFATATARVALGPLSWTVWDALVPLAVALLWPLQEWALHAFVLHAPPRRVLGRVFESRGARLHRAHHVDPWHAPLIFISPASIVAAVPLVAALWLAPGLWLGAPLVALSGLTMYFALALHYEWVHYLVHTPYRPRSAFYQRLWRNHRLHHFKNEHYWYGVTGTAGDALLGTGPDRSAVETSGTARTLGVDERALRR